MIGVLDAERIKLLSTRSPYWCAGIIVVASVGLAILAGLGAGDGGPAAISSDGSYVTSVLSGLSRIGVVVLMIMSILAITSEHRFGTLRTTFLAVPQREKVLVAKAIVYGMLAAVLVLVLTFVCVVIGVVQIGSPEVSLSSSYTLRLIWGLPMYAVLCVLIGLGVGALIRQTAGAVAIVLVWVLAVETILGVLPKVGTAVGPWLPFSNGYHFLDGDVGGSDTEHFHWGPYGSLIYFAIFAVVVFAAGVAVTRRRDA